VTVKVAIVVPRYLPHLGGIENHVAAVASRLQDMGHEVTIATQLEGDRSLARCERAPNGLFVRRFPSAAPLRGQGLSPLLWRWVKAGAGQADIVHVHNFHALTTLPNVAAARTPFIFTPHYLGPGEGRVETALHAAYSVAMRRALLHVSRVICVTDSEAAAFAHHIGFAERCQVIPNGIDSAAIQAADPVTATGRLLVMAGRLEEYKQPQLVLEALRYLSHEYQLAFVGAGPMEKVLRRRANELGVAERVLFPGRLSPNEVYSWYRAAEVVLSLSRRECFGLTIAEGLAAGAAVVASDIGAHRDVISQAGPASAVVVPTTASPEDVAEAVRAARVDFATRTSSAMTTWEEVAEKTEQLYRSVLDQT